MSNLSREKGCKMEALEEKRLNAKLKAALSMCDVGEFLSRHSKGKDYCDAIKLAVSEVRRIGGLGENLVEKDLTKAGNEVYKHLQYAEKNFGLDDSEMRKVNNAMAEWAQTLSVDEFRKLMEDMNRNPLAYT
jgi:hypothetical protein